QGMPRKIKTSFDGSPRDRAISGIHDIAFRARVKQIDGREVKGVEMLVGGGTSIMPRVAPALYDFVEIDNGDYLKISEAVFRIFDRQEWLRVNRARARIKVFVDKYGIDELRSQVEEELKGEWVAERDFSIEQRLFLDDERESAPAPPTSYGKPGTHDGTSWVGDISEFERFKQANVAAQKQEGYVTVEVKIVRGDLTPEQFRGLGQIMRDYAGGYARTTVQQNLVLRWVREESAYDVWRALSELGLGDAGSREINDVVSCPGTDSCKLGITSSMGLNQAVQERIEAMEITDPLARQIHIKMSGCPNGCSQHHVADIGFYGASIKVGEHTIPAYIPHVGGVYEGGEVKFGTRLKQRLPAKRVPEAIERWIRHYEATRNEGEEWGAFVERVGTPELEGLVKELSLPVDFGLETMNTFIDWNRDVPFQVIRGEGECAV
ncbi:MAG TPA: nitrite/sulfite reductase, partial [Solirubrobacteraceae bacterium]